MRDEEPGGPYLEAIQRAFRFAREQHRGCGPAEFLVGISGGRGPVAEALDPGDGRSLRDVAASAGATGSQGAGYLHMQAQGGALALAAARGQPTDPGHLLIALLDQGTPEVLQLLSRAGLGPAAVRRAALAAIGASPGQPPILLPELTPAGTLDRPALPVTDLDARAWGVLCWRQDHLPLGRLRRACDWEALSHLERAAAGRLAQRLGLGDDQHYSLISQHSREVEQIMARSRPDLARRLADPAIRFRGHRGPHRPRALILPAGWAVWFGNRRVGLRYRWFRLRTFRHYLGSPQP